MLKPESKPYIDGHEEQLLGLYLPKQMLDIVENGYKHLVLSHSEGRTLVVFVGAVVDNSIHVKLPYSKVS